MEEVRRARQERVVPEPDDTDGRCAISVRHLSFRALRRFFHPQDNMQSVYDWVGSFCHQPVYFHLMFPMTNILLYPDQKVGDNGNIALLMKEVDQPIENCPNESVTFQGHHVDLETSSIGKSHQLINLSQTGVQ